MGCSADPVVLVTSALEILMELALRKSTFSHDYEVSGNRGRFFFHPPQNLEEEFHYCMHDKTESSGRLKGGKMERQCSGYTCSIILCPMEGLKINGNTSSAHCWTQR